jgi:hypothetical protein
LEKACESVSATKDKLSSELDRVEIKLTALSVDAAKRAKAKDRTGARRALLRRKPLLRQASRLQKRIFDFDQKLMVMNELLSNEDIVHVVQTVAKAMRGMNVSADIDRVEDANHAFQELDDDAKELSECLEVPNYGDDGDDDLELEKELDALMMGGGSPPGPPPGAKEGEIAQRQQEEAEAEAEAASDLLASLPVAPSSNFNVLEEPVFEV